MVNTMSPKQADSTGRRKTLLIVLSVIAGVVVLVGAGLFWFFGGEAPDEVDLDATASEIEDPGGSQPSAPASTGIDGTWQVDTSVGDFTFETTTTATFVGFRVEEVLNSIGSTTAVGRTPAVSGSIAIEGDTLTAATVVADMTSIVSDEPRREDAIQRSLGTSANPEASFVLTEPIALGPGAAEGEVVDAAAVGELTINGVTHDVEVDLSAQLVDGLVLVTGTTDVVFTDYNIVAPTSPAVLSVEDHGIVEFQLWLSR